MSAEPQSSEVSQYSDLPTQSNKEPGTLTPHAIFPPRSHANLEELSGGLSQSSSFDTEEDIRVAMNSSRSKPPERQRIPFRVAKSIPARPPPIPTHVTPTVTIDEPTHVASTATDRVIVSDMGRVPSQGNICDMAYYQGDMRVRSTPLPGHEQSIEERTNLAEQQHLVLVMVGLPARGKSYLARKMELFLQWKGMRAELFNVGKYRRQACEEEGANAGADFFSTSNPEGKRLREQVAENVVKHMLQWLDEGGQQQSVAILDATNSTNSRRKKVESMCREHNIRNRVVFIEVICTDERVLTSNMKQKVANSPDFAGMDPDSALASLKDRIANYEKVYETITDERTSFIKLFDMQSKVHCCKIYGHVARSLLPYTMSLHTQPRPIYLVRAGLAERSRVYHNQPTLVSSAANLSELGRLFAARFADFIHARHSFATVVTSTVPRAIETAMGLKWVPSTNPMLNPMDRGVVSNCPRSEYATKFPDFYHQWSRDSVNTRFPGGESYHDVIQRLEPMVVEIESHMNPIIIVSHVCTLQVLYSYFLGVPIEQCITLEVPKHEIIELTPTVGGSLKENRYLLIGTDAPLSLKSQEEFSILLTAEQEREHLRQIGVLTPYSPTSPPFRALMRRDSADFTQPPNLALNTSPRGLQSRARSSSMIPPKSPLIDTPLVKRVSESTSLSVREQRHKEEVVRGSVLQRREEVVRGSVLHGSDHQFQVRQSHMTIEAKSTTAKIEKGEESKVDKEYVLEHTHQ